MINRENIIELLVNFNKIDNCAVFKKKKLEKDATRLLLKYSTYWMYFNELSEAKSQFRILLPDSSNLLECLRESKISSRKSTFSTVRSPWQMQSERTFTDIVWEDLEQ